MTNKTITVSRDAQRLLIGRSRDTGIAKTNNIIQNNTASKMRISVVELPEINCSRRLSFEFERLDSPHLQHFKGGHACRTKQIG
ncbi:MAG: hypothetical protein RSB32_07745, partial [Mucinivorans sp.]